jgi:Xaa-Pro aminopeptidase
MTTIQQRIEALREELRREHLGAFIFPTTDPHHSEYTADHWKGREWISGFNGSAGTAVVTLKADVADDILAKAVEAQDYKVLGVE